MDWVAAKTIVSRVCAATSALFLQPDLSPRASLTYLVIAGGIPSEFDPSCVQNGPIVSTAVSVERGGGGRDSERGGVICCRVAQIVINFTSLLNCRFTVRSRTRRAAETDSTVWARNCRGLPLDFLDGESRQLGDLRLVLARERGIFIW
jgi:hypothetical protein